MVIKPWLLAIRPKTLSASIAPVVIGTALAYGDGVEHWPSACIALIVALLIQVGTNLANDYFDFTKGADTVERIGPQRATQMGWISPAQIKWSFIIAFSLAAVLSLFLVLRVGWPAVVIGVLAISSGILYTAGPKPLGYLGLGEFFVLIFFGPVAVGGTYYVQSFEINNLVLLAGLAPGFFSTAILTVNNLRDIQTDAKVGKKTLAVRFGRAWAIKEYVVCLLLAVAVPVVMFAQMEYDVQILLSSGVIFLAIPSMIAVASSTDGPILNKALADTGKVLFVYTLIFSLAWIL